MPPNRPWATLPSTAPPVIAIPSGFGMTGGAESTSGNSINMGQGRQLLGEPIEHVCRVS
jgi:hypothetical protein